MGIKETIVRRLFGAEIEKQVAARIPAALSSRKEDEGWRKLTTDEERNLLPVTQDRIIDIAYALWEANPLGKWIIEVIKDFILSEGVPYEAADEDVKDMLDGFWYDPVNRMDLYIDKHARELHIFGELLLPVFVAEQTGRVRLGYIDPKQIDSVMTDPENVKIIIGVKLKGYGGKPGKQYRTILPDGADDVLSSDALAMRASYADGECFYFAINNVTNSPRGRSELLVSADWLDAYEQFLFDYAKKWPQLNTFVWDLLVKGSDPKAVDEWVSKFAKKSGSVFAHNENVELKDVTPDLKAADANDGAKLFRNHILGGHGFPSFWFGGGEGEQGRALGVEMGAPAYRMLAGKQRYFKYILETIFDYVIAQALQARYLRKDEDAAYSYTINMPELVQRDIAKYTTAINQLISSLALAQSNGWVDKETSMNIFAFALQMIGYELDLDAVKEAVEKEEAEKEKQDYTNNPGPKLPAEEAGKRAGDQEQEAERQAAAMTRIAEIVASSAQSGQARQAESFTAAMQEIGQVLRLAMTGQNEGLKAALEKEQPAPVVNVNQAPITVEAPQVTVTPAPITVEAPQVTVAPAPITVEAPQVTVAPAPITVEAPQVTVTPAPITVEVPVEIKAAEKKGTVTRRLPDGSLVTEPKED